eukprot:TRINITY_DN4441_c0_g1_i1.p1 TRINITY_DN4441_c0_g1~~TRINITY_DN4441_c0_g1_i1.p1  ORF type:complete len:430 (+),score=117.43 TRINITY_DN4441_c0_g1_i1:51-1292(+)
MAATTKERYLGCVLGVAVGDAFGSTLENTSDTTANKKLHTEMIGGGQFGLLPGQWTDDTSMTVCLAESLIEKGFNPQDQLTRYVKWYRDGYRNSNGECFDIGITTRMCLEKFMSKKEDYPATTGDLARAGNGSLMRLSPIPLYYRADPLAALERAKDSSRTTHAGTSCVDACKYFTAVMIGVLEGDTKENVLAAHYLPPSLRKNKPNYWTEQPLCSEIDEIARGSFKEKNPPEIHPSGHVVKTMECVLWAFHHTETFRDGLIKVVNLGGDADTTGAIFGQIAGAYYGENSIPAEWKDKLTYLPYLQLLADELLRTSGELETGAAPSEPSPAYRNMLASLDALENRYHEIKRKVLPGVHAYKDVKNFDEDVDSFKKYSEEVDTGKLFGKDFEVRFGEDKAKLQQKLSRPAIKLM